ncbi:MAG: Ig domain-containing protein [Bacteroidales bacterium]|nr:Ig domain-containing protein [Bacteroidales bacterium]
MKFRLFAAALLACVLSSSCVETPAEVAVTGVQLSDNEIELIVGQTHNLSVSVLPDNATNKNVKWSSGVPSVATVSDDGIVVAIAMGASTVTVTTEDGGFKASCAVIVKKRVIPVESVSLNHSEFAMDEGGDLYLSASVLPKDATDPTVIWTASPESVLSVNESGKVHAEGPGEGDVTVTTVDGGFKASCHISVIAKTVNAESVTLDKESLELTVGETATLTATVSPENTTNKTIDWRSADTSIATVDQNGTVTAVAPGKVNIRAVCGAVEGICQVTVKAIHATGITVEPQTATLMEGETLQLKATVYPASADQTVEWASNDTKVAKVDANGLVTATGAGKTQIYARSKAFNDVKSYCELTVNQDTSLKGIALSSTIMTIKAGESRTLTVTFTPSYAANKNIKWTSSNNGVAAVSQEGTVTGMSEGEAIITATAEDGGHTASCKVTVSGSSGPVVYYWNNSVCYMNGVPDPRNGAFDAEKFTAQPDAAKGADCVGKTLYTIESYKDHGVSCLYLCKDREPVWKLPDALKHGTISGFCATENYYALLFKNSKSDYSVWKGKYGEDPVEVHITGTFKEFEHPKIAALNDGRIIVAVRITDSFNDRFLARYVINNDNKVDEYNIHPHWSLDPAIAVTESGDDYIFGVDIDSDDVNYYKGYLYKNGEFVSAYDKLRYTCFGAIALHNGDVYTAVYDQEQVQTRVRKGDNVIYTIYDKRFVSPENNRPMYITKSGDVYLAGSYTSEGSALFLNGELLYSGDYRAFECYCIAE